MLVIGRSEVAETVTVWLAQVQGLHKCDEAQVEVRCEGLKA